MDFENDYEYENRATVIRGIISKCIDLLNQCNSTIVMKEDYMDIFRNRVRVGPLRDAILEQFWPRKTGQR